MKKENSNTTKYRAPAIERAFHILELLATSSIPLTSTRIAKLLEKTPGEVFRMLEVLIKLGYVTKDSTTATFTLSLKIFLLSQEVSLTNELIKAAGKPMLDLQKETDQASYLVLLNKGDGTMVTVHQQAALSTFYINQPPGKTTPVSIGSSGISILSRLPEELIDEILRNDDVYFRGTQKYKKEVWQKIRERKQDERVYIDYEFGL